MRNSLSRSRGAVHVLDTAPAAAPATRCRHQMPVSSSVSVKSSGTVVGSPTSIYIRLSTALSQFTINIHRFVLFIYFIYLYTLILKRSLTSEAPFLSRDGRNHEALRDSCFYGCHIYPFYVCVYVCLRYSLHLPSSVGLSGLDNYTGMADPPKVVTNPSTNRARHNLTSLM